MYITVAIRTMVGILIFTILSMKLDCHIPILKLNKNYWTP